MAKDASTVAQKWATAMAGASTAYVAGVNAVTVAPGQAAAKQAAVWAQNTAAAQQKYARNVGAVSLGEWQQAAANKGAQRLASGASAAQPKVLNALQQLLPKIDAIKASLPPRGSLDQNIARMTQFVQQMSQVQITK